MRKGNDDFHTPPLFEIIFGVRNLAKNREKLHLDVPAIFSELDRNNSMPTIQAFSPQKIE